MSDPPPRQWSLRFQDGTVVLEGASIDEVPMGYVHDGRVDALRGPAWLYADTVRASYGPDSTTTGGPAGRRPPFWPGSAGLGLGPRRARAARKKTQSF